MRLEPVARAGYRLRMTARYAIYAAPEPETALWAFGSQVIGYDAARGVDAAFPAGAPFDAPDWATLTDDPRRYGFHGTLKAPFSLATGAAEAELLEAAMLFAERRAAFVVALKVAALSRFVALVPAGEAAELAALAGDCVTAFERFRAPLSDADRARRLASPLSPRQIAHLDRWGYPYVFDDFRFHMTLTGRLPDDRAGAIRAALAERFAALDSFFVCNGLVVFRQTARAERFTVLARFPFEG